MLLDRHRPPYKTAGAVFLVIATVIAAFIYLAFRGELSDKTQLTLLSPRAGLVVERGSKVTFNGVEIGRVARIGMVDQHGTPEAKLTLDVNPRYISFSSPESPSAQRISAQPRVAAVVGGNGYSLSGSAGPLASLGAPNPWVYPDNLPRVNAHGGPDEPHRTRPTDPDRLRVGPPDRGEHHQSLMVDINSC